MPSRLGRGVQVEDLLAERVEARRRDHVVGERRALRGVRVRRRIVDPLREFAKIAASHAHRGDGVTGGIVPQPARTLISEEEKRVVEAAPQTGQAHGSADGAAELIEAVDRLCANGGNRTPGRGGGVAVGREQVSVEHAGSRSGDVVDDAADGPAELRTHASGLHAEFLQRIGGGKRGDAAVALIGDADAVDDVFLKSAGGRARAAVDRVAA